MTDRLPGKFRASLHSLPWFHSGKVPDIKYSYSTSGLTPSKYPVRVRSLVPGHRDIRTQREFFNVDETKTPNFYKEFPEYSFLRENEIILSVEHCDGCQDHQQTTRHNLYKYISMAQNLKVMILGRFPMVKMVIKPISQIVEKGYANTRIGAFQIQICTKVRGRVIKETLHSKLQTKKWPVLSEVIKKLTTFLPVHELKITLVNEEAEEGALKGIKVKVQPKELQQVLRPGSAVSYRSLRPTSHRQSNRSIRPKPKIEMPKYQQMSDREGLCLFRGLPLDVYQISIQQSKDFAYQEKLYNAFNEQNSYGIVTLFINLRSRHLCFIKIILQDSIELSPVKNANLHLQDAAGQKFYMIQSEPGIYTAQIAKNEYSFIVNAQGYKEVIKKLDCVQTNFFINEYLEPPKPRSVKVQAINIFNGKIIPHTYLFLSVNESSPLQGVTNSKGEFEYSVDETGIYLLTASYNMSVETYTQFAVLHSDQIQVNLPIVPVSQSAFIIISWPNQNDDLEIQAATSKKIVNSKFPSSQGLFLHDYMKEFGIAAVEISQENVKKVRIYVRIQSGKLSTQGKAPLREAGLSAQVIISNRSVVNVLPGFGTGLYWDIGVFKSSVFLQTNVISDQKPQPKLYVDEYIRIITRLQQIRFDGEIFPMKTEYGNFQFVSAQKYKEKIKPMCSQAGLDYMMKGLITPQGVNMTALEKRWTYQRTEIFCRQNINKFWFAEALGIEDDEFMFIAEQAAQAELPQNWSYTWNLQGKIRYYNEKTLEKIKIHPQLEELKKRLEDARNVSENQKTQDNDIQTIIQSMKQDCEGLKNDILRALKFSKQEKKPLDDDLKEKLKEKVSTYIENLQKLLEETDEDQEQVIQYWMNQLTEVLEKLNSGKMESSKYSSSSSSSSSH